MRPPPRLALMIKAASAIISREDQGGGLPMAIRAVVFDIGGVLEITQDLSPTRSQELTVLAP
jgi:hypothetical protein